MNEFKDDTTRYVALLRGINVGGHHKVPMSNLCKALEAMGFENIVTLLNSGNVIFDATKVSSVQLEKLISEELENIFGFPIPVIIRKSSLILELFKSSPFKNTDVHKDIRLYISFLKINVKSDLILPWKSADKSFEIIGKTDKTIFSVLNLSVSKTTKAMEVFEKVYGTNITTRNWKTIERIVGKL